MKNLNPLNKDESSFFEDVVNSKRDSERKTILRSIIPIIRERYSEYCDNQNNLQNISDSTCSETNKKNALKHCYEQKKKILLNEIISNQSLNLGNRCQYCDRNDVNTLDHYLPKGKYAEFSILGLNLIPCCSKCNSKKGENWKNGEQRQFINFYYDSIDETQFISCSIDFTRDQIIQFQIIDSTSHISEIMKSHCKELNLFFNHTLELNEQLNIIMEQLHLRDDELKNHLLNQANIEESKRGKNSFIVVFYRELANKIKELREYKTHL